MMKKGYLDMTTRLRQPGEVWYGGGRRIGDRAGAFVQGAYWKYQNPQGYLAVYDDVSLPECQYSKELDANWLFKGIADHIQIVDKNDPLVLPNDLQSYQRIHNRKTWEDWHNYRCYLPKDFNIKIEPKQENKIKIEKLLKNWQIEKYLVIQPLIDALYNVDRNQKPEWWAELISFLARKYNVVVVGDKNPMSQIKFPQNVYKDFNLTTMSSLALVEKANLFIGGESGLVLWSPILQTPTFGLLSISQAGASHESDTSPISFGKPVRTGFIFKTPEVVFNEIENFINFHSLVLK